MPRDISSSSSEDEADSPTQKSPEKQKESDKKTTRYQCPADFVSFRHKPCGSTLTESLKNNKNELWLIKAPASFNPECFSGIKVPLSGLQTLQVPAAAAAAGGAQTGSSKQIFSILASTHGTSGLSLLTSNKKSSAGVAFGPTFSGLLNVCESYGDSSTNQAPHIIPAAPAPSIPPGLKQRFHPFGSKTPTLTCVAESETDGAAFGPSSTTLRPLVAKRFVDETWHREEEEEGRKKKKKKKEKREVELQQEVRVKVEPVIPDYVMMEEGDALEEKRKKKKKKKEKRIKTEREEEQLQPEVRVKVEPVTEIQDYVMMEEGDALEEKRKKKKKDREREEVEEGVEPSVSVKVEQITVKSEPIDTWYSDMVEGSVKKKKKKKKSKTDDD